MSLTLYPAIGDVPRPGYYHIYKKSSGKQFRVFYDRKEGFRNKQFFQSKDGLSSPPDINFEAAFFTDFEDILLPILRNLRCDFATCFFNEVRDSQGKVIDIQLFDLAIEKKILKPSDFATLVRGQYLRVPPLIDVKPIGFNSLNEYQEMELPPHVEGFVFKSASYMFKLHTFDWLRRNNGLS